MLKDEEVVRCYLENGADPNAAYYDSLSGVIGLSPMAIALREASKAVIDLLASYGGKAEPVET